VDSALAAYARFLDAYPNSGEPVFAARFRRAELLEHSGRWEQARSEYRALATLSPTHELSLRSSERIVAHHLSRGETELGRIEAQRSLEQLDRLIGTVSDGATLARIRHVRARTLLAIGSFEEAFQALEEIWSRHGDGELGATAGFMAARVAKEKLRDPERARRLYQELAARSHSAADQETARAELSRLRRERG
jgi:tetratricopeptide (TPR) repeat protein